MSLALSKIYRQEFDIGIPEWRVLAQLAVHSKLYAKDIGQITAMDKSKVSRAVKLLEKKHYLNKQINEQDNRAVYLSLTEQGSILYQHIAPKALKWEKQLINTLAATEYRELMTILKKLDSALQEGITTD